MAHSLGASPTGTSREGEIPFTDLAAMAREVWPGLQEEYLDALLGGAYIGGDAVTAFERAWAQACGTRYAVGVANGTDALVLALEALGLRGGDEVVLPSNTFVATAEAVVRAGGVPRFADVDPRTLLLTPETVAAQLTPRTRGVIPVHLFGQMPDMDQLTAQAAEHGLFVLEDAAQAHGARWAGRPAGSFGSAGCFSFYPGKNLGAFGDAGAVVTSHDWLADDVRALGNHGRGSAAGHHDHDLLGTNSRLDALQALVLSAKLARNDEWTRRRRRIAERYRSLLDHPAVVLPAVAPQARHVFHLFVVQVSRRDVVREELSRRGVHTGIHYPVPCHRQPALKQFVQGSLPVVEAAAETLLSLPMFPHLRDDQVDRVAGTLLDVLTRYAPHPPDGTYRA